MVNATPRPLYPRNRDPVLTVQDAGCVPGPVWTCAENLAPTGIRSPDRPARSESLYRLSYPCPRKATSSFVVTERPSVCTKQHLSDRKDCRQVLYQALLPKSVDTFGLCLQPDRKKTLHSNICLHALRIYTDDRRSSL
jgi:hypothetical protein